MKKWIFTLVTLVLTAAVVFIVINSNTLEKPDYKNVSLKEYKQKNKFSKLLFYVCL
ncbi:hypothetical protein ACT7DL_16260 [Bacillus paranthracis]